MSLPRQYARARRFCAAKSNFVSNMPGEIEYHEHMCVRWKKNSDLDFYCCDSPNIQFRSFEFKLRLVKPLNTSLLVMYIQHPVLDGVYEIETFLLEKNGSKVCRNTKFLSYDSKWCEEIWSIDRKFISSNEDNLITNGMLNFVCVLNYPQCRCHEYEKEHYGPTPTADSSLEELSLDLSNLYVTGDESDVSLQCGDRTVPVHKLLLTARSEVFGAMFRNDMTECREGVIRISDFEFPILDLLLRYIYSGRVEGVSGDTAVQLYTAADKYAVHSLRRKCAAFIVDGLTEDNACDVLVLADLHSDQELKDRVVSFLRTKQGFLLSSQWSEFSKRTPALAVEVYDAFVRGISIK